MKSIVKIFLVVIILIGAYANLKAQKGWGVGASGIYNFNTKEPGIGARVLIPVKDKGYGIPYVYYYFPSNNFSGGLAGMYTFYKTGPFSFYAIVTGTFRGSVSVSVNDSTASNEKSYEAEGEAGAGVWIGRGCLKGMIEPRYAVVSEEVTLRAGFVLFFSCKHKKKGGKSRASYRGMSSKKPICPAYE
ncbi:MAG: hypothetical protein CVU05_00375 [Bacteroidetes bacterium HGW-Bacteroidetes-21]|nr:MAG: hypothetical protein CVU05_00375 [Bacteroidetes bacterium HGW-Bacteroidetes-21]